MGSGGKPDFDGDVKTGSEDVRGHVCHDKAAEGGEHRDTVGKLGEEHMLTSQNARSPGKYQMPRGQKAPPQRLREREQLDIKMSEEDTKPRTASCWQAHHKETR